MGRTDTVDILPVRTHLNAETGPGARGWTDSAQMLRTVCSDAQTLPGVSAWCEGSGRHRAV